MVRLLLAFCAPLAATAALAQGSNTVVLNATYLGAPTEWCAADQGVPVVMEMDGPDIVASPESWPVTVRERRGGQATNFVSGSGTSSFQSVVEVGAAEVIGRFSADFHYCENPWATPQVQGRWRLTSIDGPELESGRLEDHRLIQAGLPFFRRVASGSDAYFAAFGEQKFFTADFPEVTTSQMFAAETLKE